MSDNRALADPDTGRDMAADFGLKPADLVRPFKVGKGAGTNVAFPLAAPRQVGMASLKFTALAGTAAPGGEYTFKYRVRANMAGTFRVGPATVQSMYAPEFNAYSAGAMLKVIPGR